MNTNVLDTSLFTDDSVEVQEDLNQFRNNSILAFRGDVEYDLGGDFFSSIEVGGRWSRLEYDQLPRVRNEFEVDDNSDFLDGAFADQVGGVDVLATIELDVGTGDERDLANALGLGDFVGFGTIGGGNDLNNDTFEGISGLVPNSTATFTIDSNGDFDITATAAELCDSALQKTVTQTRQMKASQIWAPWQRQLVRAIHLESQVSLLAKQMGI